MNKEEKGEIGQILKIKKSGNKYMFYSIYQSNLLREKYQFKYNIKYDFVIVISFDIMLYSRLDFKKFEGEFQFHPRRSIHFGRPPKIILSSSKYCLVPSISDRFYFSTPSVISEISKYYFEFDQHYKNIDLVLPSKTLNVENLFFEYIRSKNIIPKPCFIYFALKRKDPRHDVTSFYNNELLQKKTEDIYFKKKKILRIIIKMLDWIIDFLPKTLIMLLLKGINIFKNIELYIKIKKGI
ncbi:MAG: hypothetical protein OXB84_05900 [Halobacteriovoraceae bacterium]|nr:hypothetical protein [Halobacteriovoraceae bacterium]